MGNMHTQRGAALLVSLMMLLLLTVLAVSAVNMTSLGLRSTANMQDQQLAEAAVQAVIDNKLSGGAGFFRGILDTPPPPESREGYTVNLTAPACLGSRTAGGFEERYGEDISRFDNAWKMTGSVSGDFGESVSITQGVILKVDIVRCVPAS